MSIFRRKYKGGKQGRVYWMKFTFGGQEIWESTKSTSKDLAREAERRRRRALETGYNRIERRDPMPLIRAAAKAWLAEKQVLAPKTVAGYRQRVAPIVEAFGDRLVCDIRREDITSYRSKRLQENLKKGKGKRPTPRTVNYEVGCVRGILNQYGLWLAVAAKGTTLELKPLKENHDVGRAISYEDEDTLLKGCAASPSPCLLPAFVMAIDTGLRQAELQSLRRRDLTLAWRDGIVTAGSLVVPKSKTEGGKGRWVPFTPRLCATLTTWLSRFADASPDSYIFPRHSVTQMREGKGVIITRIRLNQPMQSWQRSWRRVLKETGLKYRWHDLRHSFITRLAENPKVSEETIKTLAGHVSKKMLERYSHIRVQRKEQAITAIAAAREEYEAALREKEKVPDGLGVTSELVPKSVSISKPN